MSEKQNGAQVSFAAFESVQTRAEIRLRRLWAALIVSNAAWAFALIAAILR